MIVFPNVKINIGLNITDKRPDGYHNIETVMVPVGWCDILEVVRGRGEKTCLYTSGRPVDCPPEKNLVIKAYDKLSEKLGGLPPVDFYLHKVIPDGAGLGGGSSDAAFALRAVNELLELGLGKEQLAAVAAEVGSDCPFFIYNTPMLATGTGTTLTPVDVKLGGKKVVIVKAPDTSVSTAQAYAGVRPEACTDEWLDMLLTCEVKDWTGVVKNDFEPSVTSRIPEVRRLIDKLKAMGAEYAAMTGSGSAVYGIFEGDILSESLAEIFAGCQYFVGAAGVD